MLSLLGLRAPHAESREQLVSVSGSAARDPSPAGKPTKDFAVDDATLRKPSDTGDRSASTRAEVLATFDSLDDVGAGQEAGAGHLGAVDHSCT